MKLTLPKTSDTDLLRATEEETGQTGCEKCYEDKIPED